MLLCLFEDPSVVGLRPLVETRATYALRLGGRTVLETTRDAFAPDALLLHVRPALARVTGQAHPDRPVNRLPDEADVLFVNGRFVAGDGPATAQIRGHVPDGDARVFVRDDEIVAAWLPDAARRLPDGALADGPLAPALFSALPATPLPSARLLAYPWDLLDGLGDTIRRDIRTRTDGPADAPLPARPHATVHESVSTVRPERVHLRPDSTVKPGAVLNAENGPVLLDEGATVHERAVVKGPCYVGPTSEIKVGADLDTSAFGYWCKVGGEVHDSVLHSLSNKAHPGFLGHAYLGRWCNLGADTNNSNLKNDYGPVSAYAPAEDAFVDTGRQFAGLFMGDHSKCGINTMFNTGTVVGTFCNVYGGDFPPRYLPPFSWGSPGTGFGTYRLSKALSVAERVLGRRDTPFTEADEALLSHLHETTAAERRAHHD